MQRDRFYGLWEPLDLRPLVETRRVTIAGVSYCWYAPGQPDPDGKGAGHGIVFVEDKYLGDALFQIVVH